VGSGGMKVKKYFLGLLLTLLFLSQAALVYGQEPQEEEKKPVVIITDIINLLTGIALFIILVLTAFLIYKIGNLVDAIGKEILLKTTKPVTASEKTLDYLIHLK